MGRGGFPRGGVGKEGKGMKREGKGKGDLRDEKELEKGRKKSRRR